MEDLFAIISLSLQEPGAVDKPALLDEMKGLGLSQCLTSTEGHPVTLPELAFAGSIALADRMETHRKLHRGLNAALKRLNLHGRFFILVSPDVDWSCCHF
jgi:hypothetical protein